MTTSPQSSWLDLFRGENGLRVAALTGAVGLHATNVFIGATLLPSVVEDIGGLDLFAWNTTIFIVASILASIYAATRPFSVGPRANFIMATIIFALGNIACGAAVNMEMMLAGRFVQGFGAGLLVAMTHQMIRVVFEPRLWPRAMALISGVWGVATLIGPAIGGIFAEFDIWRWAFWMLLPFCAMLGLLALRVIPKRSDEHGSPNLPFVQIFMLIATVILASLASRAASTDTAQALILLGFATLALLALVFAERHMGLRLFPTALFTSRSPLTPLLACMLLLQIAITSDVFVPLFLQRVHGQSPLLAGYLVALVAMGWTAASFVTSSWTGRRADRLLSASPAILAFSMIGVGLTLSQVNFGGNWMILTPVAITLFGMGLGIGSVWPHLMTRVLHAAPDGEKDKTAAAITMVQLVGSGIGAALGGVTVNMAGLVAAQTPEQTAPGAFWLMVLMAVAPAIAVGVGVVAARRNRLTESPRPS